MSARIAAVSGLGLALLVAACGGGPATSGRPVVSLPPISSIAIPSLAIPSLAVPSIAIPSIEGTADPDLEARFPTTLPNATLGTPETGHFLDVVVGLAGADGAQQFANAARGAGMDANAITYGAQTVTMNQNDVIVIQAIRTPGGDANAFVRIWPQMAQIVQPEESPPTISQTTLDGKTVNLLTIPGGTTDYVYVTGDVAWRISGGDDAEVAAILDSLE